MPERFKVVFTMQGAIQVLGFICVITAFDKQVPLINTLVFGNLVAYCHKSYTVKN